MVTKKTKQKQKGLSPKEIESEINQVEKEMLDIAKQSSPKEERKLQVKASKSISQLKKGDKIKIDDKEYEIDSHYVLINHETTKEMAIELFDPITDKDYQLRYFSDQLEATLELYELQEIIYLKKPFNKIEW